MTRIWILAALYAVASAPADAQPDLADTTAAVRWNLLADRLGDEVGAAWARAESLAEAGDSLTLVAMEAAGTPPNPSRLYAFLGAAQYRAALDAGRDTASVRAAVAAASAALLAEMSPYPETDVAVWRALAADLLAARRESGRARADAGERLGRACAARILEWAKGDRSAVPWTGTIPAGVGMWTSNAGQMPVRAALPGWRPWLLVSAAQFRPSPPPAFGSPAFEAALEEVRQVARDRTPAQAEIARHWAEDSVWEPFVADALARRRATETEAARLYGVLGVAGWDTGIACFEAKYHYMLLRPFHADTTLATVEAVGRPNHPSYPSGHACFSGMTAAVLAALLPDDAASIRRMAVESPMSRLYGGIHYRFDNEAGAALGRAVGEHTLAADREGRLLSAAFDGPPPASGP